MSGKSPELSNLWTATALTRRLLARADLYQEDTPVGVRTARTLVWAPSRSALQRIAAQNSAPEGLSYAVKFTGLNFYTFRTGKAFVHAVLRIDRLFPGEDQTTKSILAAAELLEAVAALTRAGELGWYNQRDGIKLMPTVRITTVLEALVKGATAENEILERVYTYAYVRFAGPVASADADNIALQLARHYTSDYALKADAESVARVRDFDTVGHVITLEGAATVVAPDSNTSTLPPFLENFATATLHQHYIPIALLALHEHAFLIDKTTESSFWPSLTHQTIERLKQLRHDLLSFRLAFRFSQVSLISMHNAMNRAFRQALNLDGMLRELSADVAEATSYLDAEQREKESKIRQLNDGRFFSLGRMGAAALIGFAAFNIANAVLREVLETPQPYAGLLAVVFMLVSAIGAFVYQWTSQRHSSEHRATEHLLEEISTEPARHIQP